MIKYLGSKRRLVPRIVETIAACEGVNSVLDAFSGTARVGQALKAAGFRVHANDHNAYAATLAACYVGADRRRVLGAAERLIAELDALSGEPGWFTDTFCERSRYLQPFNGARVDAIRERVASLSLEPVLEAIALTSLMEAADRVDSTVGLQMAYLKQWAARSHQPLRLRMPEILDGEGEATALDAAEAAAAFEGELAYLDPPYNQHSYLGNYHVWESLVRWDKPEVYGVAMKRTDVRERGSDFNRRGRIEGALQGVLARLRARWIVVSFSDEGYLTLDQVRALLSARGEVRESSVDHPRHIGHKIGVFDLEGKRVGIQGHARNREHLFVVDTRPARTIRAKSPSARGRAGKLLVATP